MHGIDDLRREQRDDVRAHVVDDVRALLFCEFIREYVAYTLFGELAAKFLERRLLQRVELAAALMHGFDLLKRRHACA